MERRVFFRRPGMEGVRYIQKVICRTNKEEPTVLQFGTVCSSRELPRHLLQAGEMVYFIEHGEGNSFPYCITHGEGLPVDGDTVAIGNAILRQEKALLGEDGQGGERPIDVGSVTIFIPNGKMET